MEVKFSRDEQKAQFYKELKRKINTVLSDQRLEKKAYRTIAVKVALYFPLWMLACYSLISGWLPPPAAYLLLGLASLLLIFNFGHDASHGALFKDQRLNKLFSYTFNLVGSNEYSWHLKHNLAHHPYPNVEGADHDIQTGPLFRVSPYAAYYRHYKYQHWYILIVYMFLSLLLIFYVDIYMMLVKRDRRRTLWKEWGILLLTKLVYIGYMLVLPIWLLPFPATYILLSFLLMHAVTGLIIALVFQPSHYLSVTAFEMPADGRLQKDWAVHQVETTVDISRKSKLLNFLIGGLNANVLHHLFPTMNHAYFTELADIVKETSEKYGVNYHEYSLGQAIYEHFIFLKKAGGQDE